ncbi:uncharacterized protein CLUP02_11572 [Colletotrichum lupini]|uniref:Uncharacterized protein n=1 Tax=Colletotrichum lupini TaxID=145971 RepID=A0A9Q8T0N7_9PEZI|nr:uncharacterized protein CLUP02_11572 [Colletotrichum lupini]UQC86072.1 hypothetical protein CLUP02_11572 [Colletotrichum lupini]
MQTPQSRNDVLWSAARSCNIRSLNHTCHHRHSIFQPPLPVPRPQTPYNSSNPRVKWLKLMPYGSEVGGGTNLPRDRPHGSSQIRLASQLGSTKAPGVPASFSELVPKLIDVHVRVRLRHNFHAIISAAFSLALSYSLDLPMIPFSCLCHSPHPFPRS